MSDIDVDVDMPDEDELEAEVEVGESEEATKATAAADAAKRQKDDLPEGVVTPTGLTNFLNKKHEGEPDWVTLKPQQMYGWFKTGKDFPGSFHTDGRYICVRDEGEAWCEAQIEKAKERKATKAQKAVEAAKAAETASATPEVEADAPDVEIA